MLIDDCAFAKLRRSEEIKAW